MDTPPPRRAKLQLLVRGEDPETYEIREVSSALGFQQSRPQRLPADSWELAEVRSRISTQQSFILKNTATDRFLHLSAPERFLWEQMDGRTSLQEIATAYVLEYGEFDFEIIPNLIRKLQRAQLLTLRPTSRLRRSLARNRGRRVVKAVERTLVGLERIRISSSSVHGFFEVLYRWGGWLLFTRAAAVACLALAVSGLLAGIHLWPDAATVVAGFGGHGLLAILAVKLLFIFTLGGHQIVHALACVHHRRRVREFGFTFLHGFVPTFYVDVTDIFMASRRARVVTAVSGALVHLVLGSVWFLAAVYLPLGFAKAFAATSGLLQWQAFVIALYPFCFVEMDGYHVFVDVLGVPSLKQDALAFVGTLRRTPTLRRLSREEWLWVAYVVISVVSVAAFFGFNAWVIAHST
jgi:putative peptide zinc metalloprotease protein